MSGLSRVVGMWESVSQDKCVDGRVVEHPNFPGHGIAIIRHVALAYVHPSRLNLLVPRGLRAE